MVVCVFFHCNNGLLRESTVAPAWYRESIRPPEGLPHGHPNEAAGPAQQHPQQNRCSNDHASRRVSENAAHRVDHRLHRRSGRPIVVPHQHSPFKPDTRCTDEPATMGDRQATGHPGNYGPRPSNQQVQDKTGSRYAYNSERHQNYERTSGTYTSMDAAGRHQPVSGTGSVAVLVLGRETLDAAYGLLNIVQPRGIRTADVAGAAGPKGVTRHTGYMLFLQ